MKKLFLTILSSIVVTFCFAQVEKVNCNKLKKGKFMYVNDSSNTVLITRRNKLQEEFIPAFKIRTLFKIHWTADCEYELTQIGSNSKRQRKQNTSVTKIKIVNIYHDRYDYTCACKDSANQKKNGTVMIMKE